MKEKYIVEDMYRIDDDLYIETKEGKVFKFTNIVPVSIKTGFEYQPETVELKYEGSPAKERFTDKEKEAILNNISYMHDTVKL